MNSRRGPIYVVVGATALGISAFLTARYSRKLQEGVRALFRTLGVGSTFVVYKAHDLAALPNGDRLVQEAESLVESMLKGVPDCGNSYNRLPCSFIAVAENRGCNSRVASHVRMTRSNGTDLSSLQKMIKMGSHMIPAAKQKAAVAGLSEDIVDDLVAGRDPGAVVENTEAYLSSLVVAPEFQGQGLGKVMARIGVAHAIGLGCKTVTGFAANDGLVPFYERLGAMVESSRPTARRLDIPKVKIASNSRSLAIDLQDFQGHIETHVLGQYVPKRVKLMFGIA